MLVLDDLHNKEHTHTHKNQKKNKEKILNNGCLVEAFFKVMA